MTPEHCISYYDQSHSTGIDLPQPPEGCAAVSVDVTTTLSSFLQAVARMRQLSAGQTIQIVLSKALKDKLGNNPTLDNLYDCLERTEQNKLAHDAFKAGCKKLYNLIQMDLDERLKAVKAKQSILLFHTVQPLLVDRNPDDIVELYGKDLTVQSTSELFNQIREVLFKQWQEVTRSAEIKPELWYQSDLIIQDALTYCNQTQQTTLELGTEINVEQQQEVHTELKLETKTEALPEGLKPLQINLRWAQSCQLRPNGILGGNGSRQLGQLWINDSEHSKKYPEVQWSDGLTVSQQFYRTYDSQKEEVLDKACSLKPMLSTLFWMKEDSVHAVLLCQEEAEAFSRRLSRGYDFGDPSYTMWLETPNGLSLAGTRPEFITKNRHYNSLKEQIATLAGEAPLLAAKKEFQWFSKKHIGLLQEQMLQQGKTNDLTFLTQLVKRLEPHKVDQENALGSNATALTFPDLFVADDTPKSELVEGEAQLKAKAAKAEEQAKVKAEKETKAKAVEEEAKAKAEEEAKAEKEAQAKAVEEEAKAKAEEQAKAEKEAKAKAVEEEAKAKAEEEAKAKAEKEAKAKAVEEEAKAKAEEEAKAKAEKEAKAKAVEEEAKAKAEEEAKAKAEKEAKAKAVEEEAKAKAEEEAKAKAEKEAKAKAVEEEAKAKAEEEAKAKAEKEAKAKAVEEEAKAKAEEEAKAKAEKEAKAKAVEEEAKAKAKAKAKAVEEGAKAKAEEEAKAKAEKEAKAKAVEEEAKAKAEEEAKAKAEKETKAKAVEEEAKAKAEKEAKAKAVEEEAKAKAEEEAKAKAVEEEAKAKAEEEAKAKAEKETKAKAVEEAKAKAKAEEEAKAKAEKETKAKAVEEEAKAKAKAEEEAKAKAEKETKAKAVEEEAKAKAKAEKETKAKAVEEGAKAKAEEEAKAKAEKEIKVKQEAFKKNKKDSSMKLEQLPSAILVSIVDTLIKNIETKENGRWTSGVNSTKVSLLKKIQQSLIDNKEPDIASKMNQQYLKEIMNICELKRNPIHFWHMPESVKEYKKLLEVNNITFPSTTIKSKPKT